MINLKSINEERLKFIEFTHYDIPKIDQIIFEKNKDYYAYVNHRDISNDKYIITISDTIKKCPIEYQYSIIWHEFVHIYDFLNYNPQYPSKILDIMKSYSEAHAESVKLRYLLQLSMDEILLTKPPFIIGSQGKTVLGNFTATYYNNSVNSILKFKLDKKAKDFFNSLEFLMEFCGYLSLRPNGKDLLKKTMEYCKFPNPFRGIFNLLGTAVLENNISKSAYLYNDAVIKGKTYFKIMSKK